MRIRHRGRALLLSLIAASIPALASAEPVPEEYLNGEYENCMQQSASSPYTVTQRERYCECSRDEFSKLTFDEYMDLNGEVLENNLSPETTRYLESVHSQCSPHLTQ